MSECDGDFKCTYCKTGEGQPPTDKFSACKESELYDRIAELEDQNTATENNWSNEVLELSDRIEKLEGSRKTDCIEFFRWWWNHSGISDEQGYDAWRETKSQEPKT